MIEISVIPEDTSLSELLGSLEIVSTKIMPKTYKAIKIAASLIQYTWRSYAMGAPIPGSAMRIKNPTGAYARSIKTRRLSPFMSLIYTDYPAAKSIEEGTKPFDMKKTHPYGQRSRKSKKGVPYLIIPFRHGAPGTFSYVPLPDEVYEKIKQGIKLGEIELSKVAKGKKRSPNYKGKLIPRAIYKWGSRINTGIDKLEGLVVMDVGTKGSTRSMFMTFRVISANSPAFKWVTKARPGLYLTKHVVNNTREIIEKIITQGIREDIGL